MKTQALTVLLVLVVSHGSFAYGQDQVMVQFEVYKATGDVSGTTSLTDNIWSGLKGERLEAKKGPFTFFTLADLTVASVRLKAGEDGWTWDGKDQPPRTTRGRRVERVATPQVIQLVGKSFEVSVTASEPLEYFEERDDGLFEHRIASEAPGISIATRLEEGVNGRIVLRNLTFETKTVTEREPLRGVGLRVGRPVFASERIKTTISLKPGRDYGIRVLTKSEGVLFLRVRVERLGELPR